MTKCQPRQFFPKYSGASIAVAGIASAIFGFVTVAPLVVATDAYADSDTIVREGSPAGRYIDGPMTTAQAEPSTSTEAPSDEPAKSKVTKPVVLPPLGPNDVALAEVMKPGELPELTLGNKDAAVTIVEYADLTCGHCANFHNKVFPDLKKKYIDTGKVYFIMREFPLNNLSAAASMLGRCSGDEKTFPLISALFAKQADWAFSKGPPIPPLFEIAKQAGFTKDRFDTCLKDNDLLQKILKNRERASTVFKVTSTPTFFINGRRLKGGADIGEFEKLIDPMLGEG